MLQACKTGYLNATDLADYLVAKDIPFREAHHIVGEVVVYALRQGKAIEDLTIEEMQIHCNKISNDVYEALDLKKMVAAKNVPGGTAPNRVKEAIIEAKQRI